jgi:hypothetical protein
VFAEPMNGKLLLIAAALGCGTLFSAHVLA